MSIRPIEPGCLAIIINKPSRLIGAMVEVIEWVGAQEKIEHLDGKISFLDEACGGWHCTDPDGGSCVFHPSQLLRIDGGEDECITTEQDSEVTA